MKKKIKINFKIIFSSIFIILAILTILSDWFRSRIDNRVIILILLAFLPWFAKYLKSLEMFGIKADLLIPEEKKEKMNKTAKKIEIETKDNIKNDINEIDFIDNINESSDMNTRSTLIRYEIEKELKNLCNKNGIDSFRMNIRYITNILKNKKIISNAAANLIFDILPILNNAVHSNNVKIYPADYEWVNEKGILLILYLRSLSK